MNSHKVKLLNDTLDLFDVKCNESEDDRYGEPQTIISCGKYQIILFLCSVRVIKASTFVIYTNYNGKI